MTKKKIISVALAGASLWGIAGVASAQVTDTAPVAAADAPEGEIVVLGSRIPRIQAEGPAPVTTITATDILRNGYQSVPDVLRAITQNGGETQSQQSLSGADFTPGAQQVDLRGLGPNHTLVLVNGRRIADFPLPYGGNSNFTDISNIPVGLIERVEVLSGSASAIYGSDAISGVVNFQLKSKPDGTRIDYRAGFTEHGGGNSQRLSLTTGWDTGGFHGVVGIEALDQRPLWAYQRRLQDSTADSPTTDYPIARRNFLRTDDDNDYLDPGAATCASLAHLNGGTTYYASRPEYGYDIENEEYVDGRYCGSNEAIGYGTTISQRRALSGYGAIGYDLNDRTELFLDLQASYSRLKLFRDVLDWFYVAPDGNEEGTFFNPNMPPELTYNGAQLDNWYRQFTPEEMGGLKTGMTRNRSFTFNITPGIKGQLGDKWRYELAYNHAQYSSKIEFPQVVIDKANALFLGPQQGIEEDSGYPIFNADVARLYTPLTPAEYASITALSTYRPKTWVDNVSATINTTDLFQLPAGPVGFAAVIEAGNQGYETNPDPLALTQYYVGLIDSDGKGTRQHWGAGGELRVPVLSVLQLSGAGRYDHYAFAGNGFGKFTYNLGAEFRPVKSLLVRGAYGTGFRAPDLHYIFKGPGNTHTGGTDYYLCQAGEEEIGDCQYDDVDFIAHQNGNRRLRPETSTSINAGVFFQPTRNIDFSADYFRVKMKNQVLNMRIDTILRDEASCRPNANGNTEADPTSPTCVDAIARVQRYVGGSLDGEIQAVSINPINIAEETTDGIDFALHVRVPTARIGLFSLSGSYTYVMGHTIRQYPGDPVIDKLEFDSGYDIPRDKATASLTWALGRFSTTLNGQRLSKLPNYAEDGYIKASYLFNLSAQVDLSERFRLSGTVNNLFDQNPIKDRTYSGYPYYDTLWFDGVGRSFYAQITYKMGGAKL